jgi:hypothetical protein
MMLTRNTRGVLDESVTINAADLGSIDITGVFGLDILIL